jgi:23S rRNA (uracil1939-C5)-methyltransferase
VEIDKPVYGGAFLARAEGKAIFVPLTLPGEKVRVRFTESKSGYSTAELAEIIQPSPDRIAPRCPYFGVCGGCNYQHTGYEHQLTFKEVILRETLERGGVPAPEEIAVLAAEPWAYRNRVRLAFDADGRPGYRSRKSHTLIPIAECPIAAPLLIAAARAAGDTLARVPANLRPKEILLFCDAAESALMATWFAAEAADVRLESLAKNLHERFPQLRSAQLAADGRPGHPARTLAKWGEPSINYNAVGFDYRVDHGAFFQVNRWLVDALVDNVTAGQSGTLAWDLFAGVGLFARRLTASFAKVVAVESAPPAVDALESNLAGTTGTAVRATTLDFLRSAPSSPKPDLVIVDPPRTGLGAEITTLLAAVAAQAMVYVSCDPATLARDLRALTQSGYAIQSITLADLFPQTFHLETIVHLYRT